VETKNLNKEERYIRVPRLSNTRLPINRDMQVAIEIEMRHLPAVMSYGRWSGRDQTFFGSIDRQYETNSFQTIDETNTLRLQFLSSMKIVLLSSIKTVEVTACLALTS